MKKLLLLVLLILIGCSEPEPINMNEMLNERDDIYYTKDTNQPYSGPVFSLHENGQLSNEGILKNGKLEGPFKTYHENGQLKTEGTYTDGLEYGLWKFYHSNGQLKEEGFWGGPGESMIMRDNKVVEPILPSSIIPSEHLNDED